MRTVRSRENRKRSAFSLIEILVVIAIIGVLVAMLLAAIQRVRGSAARTECINNLKQIVLASHSYHDLNGAFPPGIATDTGAGVLMYLLPYTEQQTVFHSLPAELRAGKGGPWLTQVGGLGPTNPANARIATFLCPASNYPMPALEGTVNYQKFNHTSAIPENLGSPAEYAWKPAGTSTTDPQMTSHDLLVAGSDPIYASMVQKIDSDMNALFGTHSLPNLRCLTGWIVRSGHFLHILQFVCTSQI